MAIEEVPVLVVGAGRTGLCTAISLARQGIRSLLVTREQTLPAHDNGGPLQPEAARLLGLDGVRVDAEDPELLDRLRDRAAELGTEIRLHTELVWLDQGPIGVTAHLKDLADGQEYPVYADYLVGADGAHGAIRDQLDVGRHQIDGSDTWAADSLRDGRIFLAGAAATGVTPDGGMGMRDGFELGWKLAAVLHGHAGPALLDSYDDERRPTTPDGSPGSPAPSVSLWHNGATVSTVDYFDGRWVVLTGVAGGLWHSAAHAAAERLGVPLATVGLGPELVDVADELPTRYGIGLSGASLVRPDGLVAWRCDTEPPDPARTLDQVLRTQLAR